MSREDPRGVEDVGPIGYRLGELDPRRFEVLCAELLKKGGHHYLKRWGLAGSEGGYDILSLGPDGRLWVTQCKR